MSKLEEILKYVSKHNNFYKTIINEHHITNPMDITQFPILTREDLQKNRYNMFSDGYQNQYYWQQLIRKTSSGSTGIPINCYWSYQDYYSTTKILWARRKKYYSIMPNDKKITFSFFKKENVDKDRTLYINEQSNVLNIHIDVLFDEKMHSVLINTIKTFMPTWIYVRPSVLQKLISIFEKNNERLASLKYIEVYGEILSPELQHNASSFFNVPVANMYGSEEINTIAYECPQKRMHILQDNLFVECVKNNIISRFGEGELIVTSLTNKAMPLIRYNQHDIVKIKQLHTPCPCGSCEAVIEKIHGRSIDVLKLTEDIELNSFVFFDIMATINNLYDSALSYYKFIYSKSQKKLACYIDINVDYASWYKKIKSSILTSVNNRFGETKAFSFEIIRMPYSEVLKKKYRVFEIVD